MPNPELVAPAGDFEKCRVALACGADAVYLAGERFGLRRAAGNFSRAALEQAVRTARAAGKKAYVAVNLLAHNEDLNGLDEYLAFLAEVSPHALIVADAGVFSRAREICPGLPIHVSTQASVTCSCGCRFWARAGAARVILARELSLEDCRAVRQKTTCELEVFVHGAMCAGLSGACLISNYTSGRDANRGVCAQNCREPYAPLRGAKSFFALNSRDLMALRVLPALTALGIDAFKIEGRMRSALYLSCAVSVYRTALDGCRPGGPWAGGIPEGELVRLERELSLSPNRTFTPGAFADPAFAGSVNDSGLPAPTPARYAGTVVAQSAGFGAVFDVKDEIKAGQSIEFILPGGVPALRRTLGPVRAMDGSFVPAARANSLVYLPECSDLPFPCVARLAPEEAGK